jgi:hypothetical protein
MQFVIKIKSISFLHYLPEICAKLIKHKGHGIW